MLKVSHLSVSFGALDILKQISFHVREGEWLMLVGPNGAGKSTLLMAIAQLMPYAGSVEIEGRDAAAMKAAERASRMGYLRQDNTVGYHFTVEEIVGLGAYAKRGSWLKSDAAEADLRRVDAAICQVGLSAQKKQSALTLSGGELQRTFIGQLLVQDPPLLLLDEPTSHLDLKYQIETLDLLQSWQREKGRAVVSVVHDLSLALKYGTHALLLDEGIVAAGGPIKEVLTDEHLNRVYGLPVRPFMTDMLGQWKA